jgi:hypothetical protein
MKWMLALLTLSACSQWFGLSNAPSDDPDGDHIPNDKDNCPNTYNPDQSDLDGNGIGDACDFCGADGGSDDDDDGDGIPNECDACDNRLPDNNGDGIPDACETLPGCTDCAPCALGPAHDEDGDLIADACDLCAIDGLAVTPDVDGDGVGDPCDATIAVTPPSRQLFDPFAAPNQDWLAYGPDDWKVTTDVLRIQTSQANPASYRFLGTGFNHFVLRTIISGTAGNNNSQIAGLIASRGKLPNPDESFQCKITFPKEPAAPSFDFTHGMSGIMTTAISTMLTDVNHYQMTLDINTGTGAETCTVVSLANDQAKVIQLAFTSAFPFATGVESQGGGNASFEYFQMASDN